MKQELFSKKKNHIWTQGTKWALVFMLTVLSAPLMLIASSKTAEGHDAKMQAFDLRYPGLWPEKTRGQGGMLCNVLCHKSSLVKKTRNWYGAALEIRINVFGETIEQALASVEGMTDSDTDGWTNLEELTNTQPGSGYFRESLPGNNMAEARYLTPDGLENQGTTPTLQAKFYDLDYSAIMSHSQSGTDTLEDSIYSMEWQVDFPGNGFASPVAGSGLSAPSDSTLGSPVQQWTVTPALLPNQVYSWRVRFAEQNPEGFVKEWGQWAVASFNTGTSGPSGDVLTVQEGADGQITSGNAGPTEADVEMLRWQMQSDNSDNGSVVVSDVKISFLSGDNTKISNLYLYLDTNSIGFHDGESILSTFSWNAGGYYELASFSETVGNASPNKYLICADLNGAEADAIQLQLRPKPGTPDGILINTAGTGDTNDGVTDFAAVSGATITASSDSLSADDAGGQIGAGSANQSEADVELLRFRLVNDGAGNNSVEVNTVRLAHAQGANTDLTNVRLVRDIAPLGTLESEPAIGGTTFSWTGSAWELNGLTETVAGTVDYLVVADITPGAALGNVQLQLNATPGAPDGLVVNTATGDAVANSAVTGGAINITSLPKDTLTVQVGVEGQIGSSNANKTATDVLMLRWQMDSDTGDNSQVVVNNVLLSFVSGDNTKISTLYLYEDTGSIGVHDGDPLLDTFTWNPSGYYELSAFSTTVTGTKKYLVCADLNGAEADAIQLQLRAKPGAPDGISIDTTGGGDLNDVVADYAAISGATITINGDALSADDLGGQIGAGSANQSEADVELLRFRLVNDGNGDNSVEVNTVRLAQALGANTDLTNMRLVRDIAPLGTLESEPAIGTTFSWTGSVWELNGLTETVAGTVDYLVVADITPGAALENVQLQLNATPGAPDGLVVNTATGDAVANSAVTGGAITINPLPKDTLTVQEGVDGQIASGNANKTDADVLMLRWQMDSDTGDNSQVVVNNVLLSFVSGDNTKISTLYLYEDTGSIGVHDGDPLLDTFTWNPSGYYELSAFSTTVTGTKKYLVCADLNGAEADAIQLQLRAKPGSPDGISIDTTGGGDLNDVVTDYAAISGATITINGDALSADDAGGQIGPASPIQGAADVELLRFRLVNDGNGDNSVQVNTVRLAQALGADTDLTNVRLVRDIAPLGTLEAEPAIGTTFSWTGSVWELGSLTETVAGTVDYLVVADISATAALENVQLQLNATPGAPDGLVVNTATGDAVANSAVTGGVITINAAPGDTLTVQVGVEGQIGSGNANKTATDVLMLRWQMDSDAVDNSQVVVNNVLLSFVSGDNTKISTLYLYDDTTNPGVHDGGDPLLGTFNWNPSGYYELSAFSETVSGIKKYLVCADLNGVEADAIQLQLRAKPGTPDGISIDTGSAGDLNDSVSDYTAISGATITINGDALSADDAGGQIGPANPIQGATDVELLRFRLVNDGNGDNSVEVNTVRLAHVQGVDTDLTNVRLVRDIAPLGTLEAEPAIGTTFSWTGSVWELGSLTETVVGTVDYLVVADIASGAALENVQLQLNATPGSPDGLVVNTATGDAVTNSAVTGGVITVNAAPGDTLTVQVGVEGQIPSGNANKTATDVLMLRWQMDSSVVDDGEVVVSDVKISFVSGDDTKISTLYLYDDTTNPGVHDGGDPLLGTFNWNVSGYYELTSFSHSVTGTKKYLVCADLNGVEADAIQLQLRAKPGTPDGILINTGGAGDLNDAVSNFSAISGAVITVNGDNLSANDSSGQIGAGTANQADTDVEMLRFKLVSDANGNDSVQVTNIHLSKSGAWSESDLSSVKIYRDTAPLGTYNGESLLTNGTFSWNAGGYWELTSFSETVSGSVDYLVTADIDPSATLEAVALQLNATPGSPDGLVINTASGDAVANSAITGGAITINLLPKDTLTVQEGVEGQISSGNANKSATDVLMLRWQMDSDTGDNSQVVVNNVLLSFVSGTNTKISTLYLYDDTTNPGVHDGGDPLLGTFNWNPSGYYELSTFSTTVSGTKKYLVCADLSAAESDSIQLQLRAKPGSPDGISIDTTGGGDLNDIVADYSAISGAVISINGDNVSTDDGAGQVGAAAPLQGEADVELLRFRVIPDGNGNNSATITTVRLGHVQGTNTDLTNIRLVRDIAPLGTLESEPAIGTTFSWTGSVWELSSISDTASGTVDYLVVADIDPSAALGNVQVQLNATPGAPDGLVINSPDNMSNAAISGGVITVSAAPNPDTPTASSPVNNATVTITPTLQASAMTGGSGTHASSQFQVCSDAGCSGVVADSGEIAGTTSWVVSPALSTSTHYWWHVNYKDSNGQWSGYSSTTNADFTTEAAAYGNALNPGWNLVVMSQIYTAGGTLSNLTGNAVFSDDTGSYSPFMIEWINNGGVADTVWNCGTPNCKWSDNVAASTLNAVQGYSFYAHGTGLVLDIPQGNYADLVSTPISSVTYDLKHGGNLVGSPYSQPVKLNVNVKIIRDPQGATDGPEERTFEQAADPTRLWVEPVIYYYEGTYAGYTQKHCADDADNEMVPWTGYWIRVLDTNDNYAIKFISP